MSLLAKGSPTRKVISHYLSDEEETELFERKKLTKHVLYRVFEEAAEDFLAGAINLDAFSTVSMLLFFEGYIYNKNTLCRIYSREGIPGEVEETLETFAELGIEEYVVDKEFYNTKLKEALERIKQAA
jgi:hypothetical protein